MFGLLFANICELALCTLWSLCCAGVPPVKQEPRVAGCYLIGGYVAQQSLFHGKRRGASLGHKAETVTDAKHVSIYG